MVDVGILEDYAYKIFGIPPQSFWPALVGGFLAAAVVYFFMNIIFSRIEKDNTAIVNGISAIFAIAAFIYFLYSGLWTLIVGFLGYIVLFAFLIFGIITWTIFREHRAEHIKSYGAIHEARGELVEAKRGEIEKVLESEVEIDNKKLDIWKKIARAVSGAISNKNQPREFMEKVSIAIAGVNELIRMNSYLIQSSRRVRDRRLIRDLSKENKELKITLRDLEKAYRDAQNGMLDVAVKNLQRATRDLWKDKKFIKREENDANKQKKKGSP